MSQQSQQSLTEVNNLADIPAPPQLTSQHELPVQVDAAVFLAAQLREVLAEAANLRTLVAELQTVNAQLRAQTTQVRVAQLDEIYKVGSGTILQARPDGTYWRLPQSAVQQQG